MGTGQRIKELTKERGITLKELAEKSGVSYNTIYSITKRDSNRVQGEILQRVSAALDVSPSELIGTDVKSLMIYSELSLMNIQNHLLDQEMILILSV